mmetsp:Transcript_16557/g.19908  ORF Transcript_16557/g.19908 Transcript_16557/m.19908 type:complete len:269 (-) Transcript_16557:286-1092(-)
MRMGCGVSFTSNSLLLLLLHLFHFPFISLATPKSTKYQSKISQISHFRRSFRRTLMVPMRVEKKNRLQYGSDEGADDPAAREQRNLQRKRKDEFILNKGKLIDSFRKEEPSIFIGDQDSTCLREDVSLHIMVARLGLDTRLKGKRKYLGWFDGLRWTANAIFDYSEVGPIIILRETDRMDPTVRVRWTLRAHPWLSMQGGYPVHMDFISIFELDELGKVKQHCLTDIDLPLGELNSEEMITFQSCNIPDMFTNPIRTGKAVEHKCNSL